MSICDSTPVDFDPLPHPPLPLLLIDQLWQNLKNEGLEFSKRSKSCCFLKEGRSRYTFKKTIIPTLYDHLSTLQKNWPNILGKIIISWERWRIVCVRACVRVLDQPFTKEGLPQKRAIRKIYNKKSVCPKKMRSESRNGINGRIME